MWPFKKEIKKEYKKEEFGGVPELPELPPLPEFSSDIKTRSDIKNELPPLPSFPSSYIGEKMTSEAVKHAIKGPEEFKVNISKMPKRTREIEETFPVRTSVVKEISPSIKPEPVFIRIDKYQNALSQLQEIKKRLMEIDNLLKDIKEIRTREEAELQQWEEEISDAKTKLNNIDKTIFQKIQE